MSAPLPPFPALPAPGVILTFYVGADNATGERIPVARVAEALANAGLTGATIVPGSGLWNGTTENMATVIVLLRGPDAFDYARIAPVVAEALRILHRQESVLYSVAFALWGESTR